MRKTPSVLLMILVVGIPSAFVFLKLWPQLQKQVAEIPSKAPAEVSIHEQESKQATSLDQDAGSVEADNVEADSTTTSEIEEPSPDAKPSAIDQMLAADRLKLDTAKASFDKLLGRIDSQHLQTFGAQEWINIQALVSLAQQQPDSALAADKYVDAEGMLRQLQSDLPIRQLIADLTALRAQQAPLRFLAKLSDTTRNQPALRERLAPLWKEVFGWNSEEWLRLVQREAEDLSPEDGGFAEVYCALADFHRDHGSEEEAVQAELIAWDHATRMTNSKRASESAIMLLHRLPATVSLSVRDTRIQKTAELIHNVANPYDRMRLLSELAVVANQPQVYLDSIQTVIDTNRLYLQRYWPAIYRCKVLAETKPPAEIFDICVSIPKYNGSIGFDPFLANTMAYAYAATSAARTNQQAPFWKAMLLAEAQQLDSTGIDANDQQACSVLASADLRRKNYHRVIFSAMNLTVDALRPKLIFPVMIESAESVPTEIAVPLIHRFGDSNLGCVAVGRYMPMLAGHFETQEEAIAWMLGLKSRSVRIAAMIGFARRQAAGPPMSDESRIRPPAIDLTDSRTLLENAESDTALIQFPLERAWAYLWIAASWKQLDQPASYHAALAKSDEAVFSQWRTHWRQAEEDADSGSYRSNQQRNQSLLHLIEFYAMRAEWQAFVLNDPERAIENVISAARASQPLNDGNGTLKMRLWLITEAIHSKCGLSPGTLDSVFLPPNNFYRMLLAAVRNDAQELKDCVERIESQGAGKGFEAPDFLARAYAELALNCARNRDLDGYRSARRKAMAIITSRGAVNSLALPLHEADAYAGEFALPMNDKRNLAPLPLYGSAGRSQAVLCRQLSLAARTEDALKQLPSVSEPFYRLQAIHAVADARVTTTPSDELLRWMSGQNQQLDRIGILCGMACQKPIP